MIKVFSILFVMLGMSVASAQVRIVQWTDVHSTLSSLSQQLAVMDQMAKSFYSQHPQGEFIVYVIGDFTSISPYSQVDKGAQSFEALRLLKNRGYTVLFTPGNHDALDWALNLGGELFFQQMKTLHEWGIPVLAANLTKVRRPFKDFLIPYYELKTLSVKSALLGLTLESFFAKSNLTRERAQALFKDVQKYEDTLKKMIPKLKAKGFESLVIGAHEGHERLLKVAEGLDTSMIKIPLMMAADDHLVASYRHGETLIADAGSHGSFNVIDLSKDQASVQTPVTHIAITEESATRVSPQIFKDGIVLLNREIVNEQGFYAELRSFQDQLKRFLSQVDRRLQRVLGWTSGHGTHKYHMKRGRTDLGSLLSEAHVLWARTVMNSWSEPMIAMVNSSSYRREEPLLPGELREIDLRGMYPFENQSAVFRLLGKEIEELFFSRRKDYESKESGAYSPQLNFSVREKAKRLEILINGEWVKIKRNTSYLVVIDGFLAAQFKNKTWQKILSQNQPLATKSFQDLLVDFLPTAIYKFENPNGARSCWELF